MKSFPKNLLRGYQNFRAGAYKSMQDRYSQLAQKGQSPKVLMVACCDSRAAPETIFDANPGEIFVIRNVANLVPPHKPDEECHSTSAALEFAITALKVEHIVIMGHGRCGGIAASLAPETIKDSDFIGKWIELLEPPAQIANAETSLNDAERQTLAERVSVAQSLENLRSFPIIATAEKAGQLALHGAWFDIQDGELWLLDQSGRNQHQNPGAAWVQVPD